MKNKCDCLCHALPQKQKLNKIVIKTFYYTLLKDSCLCCLTCPWCNQLLAIDYDIVNYNNICSNNPRLNIHSTIIIVYIDLKNERNNK